MYTFYISVEVGEFLRQSFVLKIPIINIVALMTKFQKFKLPEHENPAEKIL